MIEHEAKDNNSHLLRHANETKQKFLVVGTVVISNRKLAKHYTLQN